MTIKKVVSKINELMCRIFDHAIHPIELQMFEIECKAENWQDLKPKISCRRCGKTWRKNK